EAYEVLSDPAKRKKYDTLGANWNRPEAPPGWEGAGEAFRGRSGQGGQEYEFHFGGTGFSDFFEQFFGGRGDQGFDFQEFARQQGKGGGTGPSRGNDIEGDIMVSLNEALQGSVRTISFRRQNRQTGKAISENFRVRIPLGVHEGQLIRVSGKGEEGSNGG